MLDIDKPVQTRDGRKARIICTDMKSVYPVIAVVCDEGRDEEDLQTYTENGSFTGDDNTHRADLINVSQTWWVNVYPKTLSGDPEQFLIYGKARTTKDEADSIARLDRIACIEFTEGAGLE